MRIVLHIGTEKTGTSSIQRFFQINRERLLGRSILYSCVAGTENHMALAAAAQSEEKLDDLRMIYELDSPAKVRAFRETLANQLLEEATSSACSQLVFSSEHCSSRLVSVTEVETLANILRPISRDIRIVVYLRRQDDFLCSSYSTDVKSGFCGEFELPDAPLRKARYDYFELLRRWSSVFGRKNLVCRIYDSARLKGGEVVEDFAEVIGLAWDASFERPPRVNESLDARALEFLRLLNKSVPRFRDNRLNPERGNLVQLLQKLSNGPGLSLPPHLMREFMEHFRQSNARVAEQYFGTIAPAGDPLFGEPQRTSDRAHMQSLDAESAALLAGQLWRQKQLQVLEQAERIAKLKGKLEKVQKKPG